MKKLSLALLATSASLAFATPASAAAIIYTISGNGSGVLDGVTFTDANFSFTLAGDTDDLVDIGGGVNVDPLASASYDIDGLGSGTFSIATRLGQNTNNNVVFFGLAGGGIDLFDFDIGFNQDLAVNFGPLPNTGGVFALGQFDDIATSGGALSFDAAGDVLFSGRLVNGAIPEPATWAFMILGFGAIGGAMRRQKNMARKAKVKVSYA